jgi:hypothetical protein
MTPHSRASLRPLVLTLVVAAAVGLAGCGSDTPAATSTPRSPSPSVTATTGPTGESSATPGEATGDTQLVKVEKYGIAFELPKGWITLDAKKVLEDGGGTNPVLDELADRMGMTPEQLTKTFSSSVQTISVSDEGAKHGFLENVNTVGQDQVLNDETIKLQLATIGAKAATFEHVSTPAGDVTRVPYDLPTKIGLTIRGVAIVVYGDHATVVVTVSSSSAASAAKIADQVQASLEKIPGTGPNL